jgi:hypothetical protein
MGSTFYHFYPYCPKAPIKMGSAPYLLSSLGHFLHLRIFVHYMQPLDSKLIVFSKTIFVGFWKFQVNIVIKLDHVVLL